MLNSTSTQSVQSKHQAFRGHTQRNDIKEQAAKKRVLQISIGVSSVNFFCWVKVSKAQLLEKLWVQCSSLLNSTSAQSVRSKHQALRLQMQRWRRMRQIQPHQASGSMLLCCLLGLCFVNVHTRMPVMCLGCAYMCARSASQLCVRARLQMEVYTCMCAVWQVHANNNAPSVP